MRLFRSSYGFQQEILIFGAPSQEIFDLSKNESVSVVYEVLLINKFSVDPRLTEYGFGI